MKFKPRLFQTPTRLLERGEIYRGLARALESKRYDLITIYIEWKLKLPEPDTMHDQSRLRILLRGLATQLVNLSISSADARNTVNPILKNSLAREVGAAFDALFQTCERLAVVSQLGVSPQHLGRELEQERAILEKLLEATEAAAAEMARLMLSAGRFPVEDASDKFAQLGWAARELTQFNRELE